MVRKLTVYTGKGVGVFDLSARPDMYTEPQAATIVMHDQEEHERVFTESEVRAMLRAIRHELEMNVRWQDHVEVVSASAMRQAFHRSDVLSLDPA